MFLFRRWNWARLISCVSILSIWIRCRAVRWIIVLFFSRCRIMWWLVTILLSIFRSIIILFRCRIYAFLLTRVFYLVGWRICRKLLSWCRKRLTKYRWKRCWILLVLSAYRRVFRRLIWRWSMMVVLFRVKMSILWLSVVFRINWKTISRSIYWCRRSKVGWKYRCVRFRFSVLCRTRAIAR